MKVDSVIRAYRVNYRVCNKYLLKGPIADQVATQVADLSPRLVAKNDPKPGRYGFDTSQNYWWPNSSATCEQRSLTACGPAACLIWLWKKCHRSCHFNGLPVKKPDLAWKRLAKLSWRLTIASKPKSTEKVWELHGKSIAHEYDYADLRNDDFIDQAEVRCKEAAESLLETEEQREGWFALMRSIWSARQHWFPLQKALAVLENVATPLREALTDILKIEFEHLQAVTYFATRASSTNA